MKEVEIKKKPNVILYTILMSIIFIVLTEGIIWGYGGQIIIQSILNFPQGQLVISEGILACLVLIVMLIFKNSYVFTQEKEKLSTSLFYGLYFIIVAVFMLLCGIVSGICNVPTIINLLVGCLFVGICEEFLCRGWLLNEFLERYGDTKTGVWYSIIISGIIFGLTHISNFFGGQDLLSTINQVISAASIGIIFGTIYYKTKNIWSVVLLHGFWDFSLFLMDASPLLENTETIVNFSIIQLLLTLLVVIPSIVNIIPYIKDIDAKPKKGKITLWAIVGFISLIVIGNVLSAFSTDGDTYKYDNFSLENYATISDNYEKYNINLDNSFLFELYKDKDKNLILKNVNTNYLIKIECDKLYDYIILEEEENFVIAYIDKEYNVNNYIKYIYLPKNQMSNDNQYLDTVKGNIKKYLISDAYELLIISDYENNKQYISAYDIDYGYFVLTSNDKVSILNRD